MGKRKLADLIHHYRKHEEQKNILHNSIDLYQNGEQVPITILPDEVWVEFLGSAQPLDGEELERLADDIEGFKVSQYDRDQEIPMAMLRFTVSEDNESPADDIVRYVSQVLEECFNLSNGEITNAVETNCPDLGTQRSWDEIEHTNPTGSQVDDQRKRLESVVESFNEEVKSAEGNIPNPIPTMKFIEGGSALPYTVDSVHHVLSKSEMNENRVQEFKKILLDDGSTVTTEEGDFIYITHPASPPESVDQVEKILQEVFDLQLGDLSTAIIENLREEGTKTDWSAFSV